MGSGLAFDDSVQAAALANLCTAEIGTGEQSAVASRSIDPRGGWEVHRPTASSLSAEDRWRSIQLVRLHMGQPTHCFPCWLAVRQLWHERRWGDRHLVLDTCCGMFGCPGPIEVDT